MIPPEYMAILKRWYWVIGICGVAGGLLVYSFAVVSGFGRGQSYDTSATLGVSRVLSYSGSVASASPASAESEVTANAALSLKEWTKTPQFLARVQEEMKTQGYFVPQVEIYNRVSINSDRSPGVIVVSTSGGNREKTQKLVQATVTVLQQQVQAEEDEVRNGVQTNLARLSDALRTRLSDIYSQLALKTRAPGDAALRTAMAQFFARGTPGGPTEEFAAIVRDLAVATNDPSMVVLLSQSEAVQQELSQVTSEQAHLEADLMRWPEPLIVVSPAETVESQTVSRLRKRDLIFMGGLAGLVLGWALANLAEHWRPVGQSPGSRRQEFETV